MKRMVLLKSKNLVKYTDLIIILFNYQNNYVRRSSAMGNAAKNFDFLTISLNDST